MNARYHAGVLLIICLWAYGCATNVPKPVAPATNAPPVILTGTFPPAPPGLANIAHAALTATTNRHSSNYWAYVATNGMPLPVIYTITNAVFNCIWPAYGTNTGRTIFIQSSKDLANWQTIWYDSLANQDTAITFTNNTAEPVQYYRLGESQ